MIEELQHVIEQQRVVIACQEKLIQQLSRVASQQAQDQCSLGRIAVKLSDQLADNDRLTADETRDIAASMTSAFEGYAKSQDGHPMPPGFASLYESAAEIDIRVLKDNGPPVRVATLKSTKFPGKLSPDGAWRAAVAIGRHTDGTEMHALINGDWVIEKIWPGLP